MGFSGQSLQTDRPPHHKASSLCWLHGQALPSLSPLCLLCKMQLEHPTQGRGEGSCGRSFASYRPEAWEHSLTH